jgi:hypothetical protein
MALRGGFPAERYVNASGKQGFAQKVLSDKTGCGEARTCDVTATESVGQDSQSARVSLVAELKR